MKPRTAQHPVIRVITTALWLSVSSPKRSLGGRGGMGSPPRTRSSENLPRRMKNARRPSARDIGAGGGYNTIAPRLAPAHRPRPVGETRSECLGLARLTSCCTVLLQGFRTTLLFLMLFTRTRLANCCTVLLLHGSQAVTIETTTVGVQPDGVAQVLRAATPTTQAALLPWLLIGIPTIPRPNGADYLTATLSHVVDALPDELTDPMAGQVRCMVVNQRPGDHPAFEQLRRQHTASTALLFVDRPADTAPTEAAEAAAAAATAALRPSLSGAQQERHRRVRQHTRDVVAMLRLAHRRSRLFLFMEVRGCSPDSLC